MEPDKLKNAIQKLKLAHKYGREVIKLLDKGGGKQYRKAGYQDAADTLSDDKAAISEASARHYATFARRFSQDELESLCRNCQKHSHCPSFDVVVRLLAVRNKRLRQKLTLQVLKNGWEKRRLGQEMRRLSATSSFADKDPESQLERRNRGRPSKAISSLESLIGELQDDAVKWRRIHATLLKRRAAKDTDKLGTELPVILMKDIKKLADVLQGFFDYELSDE